MRTLNDARHISSLMVAALSRWIAELSRARGVRNTSASARQQAVSDLLRLITTTFHFLHGLARELSDENAYRRHLQLTGHPHSATEWRAFSDQRQHRKYQNAKCC